MAKYATIDGNGIITAFYDEIIHGNYYQQVPDPDFILPQIPDPNFEGPVEEAPLIDDPDVVPPLISNGIYDAGVTLIPVEAFEISRETWEAWIADNAGLRWNGTALEPYVDPELYSVNILQSRVRGQAERAIAEGSVTIAQGQFATNDTSVMRMMGMLKMAELQEKNSLPVSITFRTMAGSVVNITSAGEAETIYMAASSYVAGILETSSNLQESLVTMTEDQRKAFDPIDPVNWQ